MKRQVEAKRPLKKEKRNDVCPIKHLAKNVPIASRSFALFTLACVEPVYYMKVTESERYQIEEKSRRKSH
jgi:hypothetical protein